MLFLKKNLLFYLLITPLIGVFTLIPINPNNNKQIKIFVFNIFLFLFLISLIIWILLKKNISYFQFSKTIHWISYVNMTCTFSIDSISLFFIILTTFLFPLCILINWNKTGNNNKNYLLMFLLLEFFLIGTFSSMELIMFYVFFESVLIPMFLIIGIWGSRERKIKASYYFFIYTLIGSLLMLLSITYLFTHTGSTNYEILLTFSFSTLEQKIIWISFFISFSAKIPSLPLHLWLPEAHVEAPTEGSVILAGVLLKLGVYGHFRFSLPILPNASFYFIPLVHTIAISSILYTSLTAIRQTDFKRVIAYTSIAHMNLVLIGLFSFNTTGIEGSVLQSLSHGFVASALFLIIGMFYDRYQTKIIKYYGGLTQTMPICVTLLFFFTLANMGLPGTSSFAGEFLILTGVFKINNSVGIFASISVVLSSCYALWLYNRIAYGNLKMQYSKKNLDANKREFTVILPLLFCTIYVGLVPSIVLDSLHANINKLLELTLYCC